MQISEEKIGDVWTVGLQGRLDAATSKGAEEFLLQRIDAGERLVAFDLSRLDYISSVGLRVFMMCAKRLKTTQGKLVVFGLTPMIRQVFEIAGFLSLFPVFANRDEAVAGLK
jgi:stage II sporulation protein AA (anti-sigma F factor antagonist)